MTRLQGTKPGAAVYQTSIDNRAGHLVKLHNKANQKRIGSLFPSLQIWVMFVNSDVSFRS